MKFKKINRINYNNMKPYVKVYFTFDEACYIRDYIKKEGNDTASGLLKKGLEELIKKEKGK